MTEKNVSKENDISDEDTQHASKSPGKLEEDDTQSEDIGGIGTSRSGRSVQVEHEGLQHRVEKMDESLMAIVSCVEGEQLRRSEKAKKKQEALKEKVDEDVVPIGEAKKAKDKPAKVAENASESSQADVEFYSEIAVMGVVVQINDSENN
ncbi:hypothetical protein K7X08_005274 [Anisodus acutangulus]|uniref:Uncharacterized protein n=1 Tax=Anisodus acutangulus TaxID=402998 RepID=A0A9Q1R718_9SOLA|nr:hypothetical protein K7X08_005274 [Anisodus acutangulus]